MSRRLRFEDEKRGEETLPVEPSQPDELPPDNALPDNAPPADATATSGQNVPKLESKFKQDKERARHSDKLRHEDAPATSSGATPKADKKAIREDKKLSESKLRLEKSGKKLESAKEKLAAQKPPKKPGLVKSAGRAAGGQVWLVTHSKIYQAENENVGVKAAHRAELAGEGAARGGYRFVRSSIRARPARRARNLERRDVKLRADHHYRAMVNENPELRKNTVARHFQKRRIKKQYQKQAREAAKKSAKTAAKTAKETTVKTIAIAKRIGQAIILFIKTNPKAALIILACIVLVVIIQSCVSSALTIGNSMGGAVISSTYPSEDSEMLAAEAAYSALEAYLQFQIDNFEVHYPGYDEYHYSLDEIWHDPYVLISILTATRDGAWRLSDVQLMIAMLFDLQYTLTTTLTVEVRYYTEYWSYTDPITGVTIEGSYEVAYNYYICNISLSNFNLSHLPIYIMGEEQLSRYALYMATLGNRPDLFPTHLYPRAASLQEPTRHDIPQEYIDADPVFAAMIAEANKFVGFPYVWGGYSPSTSFDCSGFVSWVLNNSGWNVGRLGAKALYNICTPVTPANARPGDLVFFWRTYDAPDPDAPTHVGIYVGDGMMIHAGNPIGYTSINTTYWQNHFFGFGRP